jgi:hypothetical protein
VPKTKKGQTLHLYTPESVDQHTPCSIIHNFLPKDTAAALLEELLAEAETYESATFRLFDNIVKSPHTACFYLPSLEAIDAHGGYFYNGAALSDVRLITPELGKVKGLVQDAVNAEIEKRIKNHYPGSKKLQFQDPGTWIPNAAFVNCYDGGEQSVGYHSDQLTYLGPRAVIGSLSLGVGREFRVRRVVGREEYGDEGATDGNEKGKRARDKDKERADEEGQIAIHLPHNSLLVMHAEMQEEWKHSIHPSAAIDPHPLAGRKRINVTYRYYREGFHPKYTPRCRCGMASVLRCSMRRKGSRGRYMWMCQGGARVDGKGDRCGFFQWAEFDDDGNPPWLKKNGNRAFSSRGRD